MRVTRGLGVRLIEVFLVKKPGADRFVRGAPGFFSIGFIVGSFWHKMMMLIIDGPDGSLLFQSLKLHIQNKFSEPADGRASFLSQCAPPATPKERHSSVA